MRRLPRLAALLGVLVVAVGAGVALGLVAWGPSVAAAEFLGLLLTALLLSAFEPAQSSTEQGAAIPPWFVAAFAALLLLDDNAMILVAATSVVTQGLANRWHPHSWRHLLLNT